MDTNTSDTLIHLLLDLTHWGTTAPGKVTVPLADLVYTHPTVYQTVRTEVMQQHPSDRSLQCLLDFLDCIHDDTQPMACAMFASFDNVTVLQHFFDHEFAWDECTVISSVLNNSPQCLKFALENNCPLHCSSYDSLMRYVLCNGSLQCLQVLCDYMKSTSGDVEYPSTYWHHFAKEAQDKDMKLYLTGL